MNLQKKVALAIRTLGVGRDRIIFNKERLNEIKEAITKQDIRDLVRDGAIIIMNVSGRKTHQKRKTRRRQGSIRKKVVNSKREYMIITRKLRRYLAHLKKTGNITNEKYRKLRTEIRTRAFKSLSSMKERIVNMEKKK